MKPMQSSDLFVDTERCQQTADLMETLNIGRKTKIKQGCQVRKKLKRPNLAISSSKKAKPSKIL